MDAKNSLVSALAGLVGLVGLVGLLAGCESKESEKASVPSGSVPSGSVPGGSVPSGSVPAAQAAPSAPAKAPEPTLAELNAFKPPTAKGKVSFKNVKDGAKLGGKAFMGAVAVKLELAVEGMTVEPAGAVHENAGHFAVGIDAEAVPAGTAVKKGYQAYEKGETEVQAGVRPGEHTLTLQFVDARNRSYGPEWAQTIKVKVAEK